MLWIQSLIDAISGIIWGWPTLMPMMIIFLLGTGMFVTFRLNWIQLFRIKHAFQVIRGKYDNPEDEGDINHFQALSAALSATVGIGNIAGVATAIHYGGPGALFWMWITAIFGMSLKYAEATLAIEYRQINPDGSASGGPMYYIEKGLGPKWKPMAVAFAAFTVLASFGTGNAIQAFTVSDQFLSEFQVALASGHWLISEVSFLGILVEPVRIITGLFVASMLGFVIIGGIKRIGSVAAKLAPTMALIYIVSAFLIIILHFDQIIPTLTTIVSEAFSPRAELTGVAGGSFIVFLNTLVWGVKRGLFSNEAGQGSAPIAHAAAKTTEPAREGVVAMVGPLIDTLIICTMTGLVIISTGAHTALGIDGTLLNGSPLTAMAFKTGLQALIPWGDKIITISVLLFALSTAISWSYYGDRAIEYLFGIKYIKNYKLVYIFMNFVGAIVSLEIVWGFGDIALGLMAIPNLIALILLSPVVIRITKDYFSREHKEYK